MYRDIRTLCKPERPPSFEIETYLPDPDRSHGQPGPPLPARCPRRAPAGQTSLQQARLADRGEKPATSSAEAAGEEEGERRQVGRRRRRKAGGGRLADGDSPHADGRHRCADKSASPRAPLMHVTAGHPQ
jgi:hypothetical protein